MAATVRSARPSVFTIPPHVAFVDALAKGLLDRTRDDPMRLARATVLLPNRRAVRALTEAFVRLSDEGGLLLPRMMPIGDIDEDEALGSFADDMFVGAEMPPAVDDCKQRLLLTGLVKHYLEREGERATTVEALRLADHLRRTLRQIVFEDVRPKRLRDIETGELAEHWAQTLRFLEIVIEQWPLILDAEGEVDAAARRNDLMRAWMTRLQVSPPAEMIVAAGMSATSPVVGRLLGTIARLPDGMVVLPGLDIDMPDDQWDDIRCHLTNPEELEPRHDSEGHPQFSFRCLLERMRVARAEVEIWPWTTSFDGPTPRSAALTRAMAPARFTNEWQSLNLDPKALAGVRLIETATPGEEAQVIALAMRRQLEHEGRTAALVTPDRGLARRVAAHLARWGISIDDTAGTPLRVTPPGTFMLELTEAAVQGFAPVPLLALLKHPLVRKGDRIGWLNRVRHLDLVLRGVRPAPGLDMIDERIDFLRLEAIARRDEMEERALVELAAWWREAAAILKPLEALFARDKVSLPDLIDRLRAAAERLAGEDLWRGPAGRALGEIVAKLEEHGSRLDPFDPPDAPGLLGAFFDETAVRPPYGKHPRLAVYGVLEARLQRADLMIMGGLNEGVWPGVAAPDPWLAPAARAQLGLPGLERKVGLSAHDFVQAMGAKRVIATRARRDASAPTVPSRFWLRLEAMGGERVTRDHELRDIARALDAPVGPPQPAKRPAPAPPSNARPRELSVTQVEKLKADPYSFYADKVLGLRKLAPLDEDPTAAERGTFIHAILERWIKEKPDDLAHLRAVADLMLGEWDHHPLMRALWAPRVRRAVDWVAETAAAWSNEPEQWRPLAAEAKGRMTLGNGITLTGRADRIDTGDGGALAIVDYKTGEPPSHAQHAGGYALQLGLLAWMASDGHFARVTPGPVKALRYWKLSGGKAAGKVVDPLLYRGKPWEDGTDIGGFIDKSMEHFFRLCDEMLLGAAPFTAKLHPEYSTRYTDHDHLARVAEWMGRGE